MFKKTIVTATQDRWTWVDDNPINEDGTAFNGNNGAVTAAVAFGLLMVLIIAFAI